MRTFGVNTDLLLKISEFIRAAYGGPWLKFNRTTHYRTGGMKILITGGAGFIGSNLVLNLQARFPSAELVILDNLSSGNLKNIEGFKAELIEGGVENENLINSLNGKGFNTIFHEAAITDTTITDTERIMRVNVSGLKNILNLARAENATVIYASSAGVYGNGPVPMKEAQKLTPLNDYALSKVKGDRLAMEFARENNLKVIGLRYFNVYGPKEEYKGKSASMIWQLRSRILEGKKPRIFKYGEQKRDFIYIKDIVKATIKAMDIPSPFSLPYTRNSKSFGVVVNIGTGISTTFNRIIEILNKVLGAEFPPEYFDNPYSFYQNHTQADITLAQNVLGFKARYSIEDGIRNYLKSI